MRDPTPHFRCDTIKIIHAHNIRSTRRLPRHLDTSVLCGCSACVGKHNHPAIVSQLLSNDKMDASLKNRDNDTTILYCVEDGD